MTVEDIGVCFEPPVGPLQSPGGSPGGEDHGSSRVLTFLEDKIQAIMKSWKDWMLVMKLSLHPMSPISILKPLPSLNKNKER